MNAPAAPTPGAVVLDEHECRDVFRACLDALTRPGTIHRVATDRHPAHLMPLLALTDLTTPVAVLPGSRTPEESVEDLRAISISSCRSNRTNCSSVTAQTFTRVSPSR